MKQQRLGDFGEKGADEREKRAHEDIEEIVQSRDIWLVKSISGEVYHVDLDDETCDCPDHTYRDTRCKHIRAVELECEDEEIDEEHPLFADERGINSGEDDVSDGTSRVPKSVRCPRCGGYSGHMARKCDECIEETQGQDDEESDSVGGLGASLVAPDEEST